MASQFILHSGTTSLAKKEEPGWLGSFLLLNTSIKIMELLNRMNKRSSKATFCITGWLIPVESPTSIWKPSPIWTAVFCLMNKGHYKTRSQSSRYHSFKEANYGLQGTQKETIWSTPETKHVILTKRIEGNKQPEACLCKYVRYLWFSCMETDKVVHFSSS